MNTSHIKEHLIRNFKPVWFISIMGTGISSSILYNFPYEAEWLKVLGIIMFGLCSFLLLTSSILFGSSLTSQDNREKFLDDLSINVFLGCYAMGFTSWVNMIHFLTKGSSPITVYVLWWMSNIFSLFTAWFIFFRVMAKSQFKLETMTPTVLLPIVSLTVTSSCGQIIYSSLPQNLQLSTMIVSFFLWSNAMGLTFIIVPIYFHRLLTSKLPPKALIFTSFILVGPFGQGSFSIQLFGSNMHEYLLAYPLALTTGNPQLQNIDASIIKLCGLLAGMFLESMGLFFTFLAVASVISYGKHNFNYAMWAMTFPLGTMSLAANQTYKITGWNCLRVVSVIYGVSLILITICCIIGSLTLMIRSVAPEPETQEGCGATTKSIYSEDTIV